MSKSNKKHTYKERFELVTSVDAACIPCNNFSLEAPDTLERYYSIFDRRIRKTVGRGKTLLEAVDNALDNGAKP
jgi:hypothetical protein